MKGYIQPDSETAEVEKTGAAPRKERFRGCVYIPYFPCVPGRAVSRRGNIPAGILAGSGIFYVLLSLIFKKYK
jgi:hypothetical protein